MTSVLPKNEGGAQLTASRYKDRLPLERAAVLPQYLQRRDTSKRQGRGIAKGEVLWLQGNESFRTFRILTPGTYRQSVLGSIISHCASSKPQPGISITSAGFRQPCVDFIADA